MQTFQHTMPMFLVTDEEERETRVMTLTELESHARAARRYGADIGTVHYIVRAFPDADPIVQALPVSLESQATAYDDADYAYVAVNLMTEHGRVGVIGWTVDGRA